MTPDAGSQNDQDLVISDERSLLLVDGVEVLRQVERRLFIVVGAFPGDGFLDLQVQLESASFCLECLLTGSCHAAR